MAEDRSSGFARYAKPTRRDEFLKMIDTLVPWSALCEEIEPHYPKADIGRPPVGLERMLRMYCVQYWFNFFMRNFRTPSPLSPPIQRTVERVQRYRIIRSECSWPSARALQHQPDDRLLSRWLLPYRAP
jgi:hypothetical protein